VAINCSALPDTLLESELFGYKKGAFTGADKEKKGRFALARKGTLFLDEIGDISAAMQVKLLRVLQEKQFEPLGSQASEKTDARIICATNRDLEAMVHEGTFRQDLYYRINIIAITIPPLRERKEDIPLLADHFLQKFSTLNNKNIDSFASDVFAAFYAYRWPGNIRELENTIERAVVLNQSGTITLSDIPPEIATIVDSSPKVSHTPADMQSAKEIVERQLIVDALERHKGKVSQAATELGMHRATLYRKLDTYKVAADGSLKE
jgi:transcriptional regulator with PAS, ATPase and Fis domain